MKNTQEIKWVYFIYDKTKIIACSRGVCKYIDVMHMWTRAQRMERNYPYDYESFTF
jgi:hypothetical protein